MPNTYACKGVSNPNVPIFPPRVCTLVLFIHYAPRAYVTSHTHCLNIACSIFSSYSLNIKFGKISALN